MRIEVVDQPEHLGAVAELLWCQHGKEVLPPCGKCRPACTLSGHLSTTANRSIVRRFIEEVLGRGDFATLAALAAPDCIDHAAGQGPAAIAQFLVPWRAAFPDLAITIDSLVAAGDRVAARWTLRGTHRGAFLGLPPAGQPLTVTGTEFYRLAGGQIVERWATVDTPAAAKP